MSSTLDINKLDLYAILHVSEEATEKEVQDQQQLLYTYTMNYSSSSSSLVTENHQRTDVYFPTFDIIIIIS